MRSLIAALVLCGALLLGACSAPSDVRSAAAGPPALPAVETTSAIAGIWVVSTPSTMPADTLYFADNGQLGVSQSVQGAKDNVAGKRLAWRYDTRWQLEAPGVLVMSQEHWRRFGGSYECRADSDTMELKWLHNDSYQGSDTSGTPPWLLGTTDVVQLTRVE